MTTKLQDFSGLFRVDLHTRSTRFLWILSVLLSSSIIIFGIWALVINLYNLNQDTESRFLAIALALFLTVLLPAFTLIIGVVKIRQKPGVYLRGIRIKNTKLEVGTLTLDVDSVTPGKTWPDSKFDNIVIDNWRQERTIGNDALEFLIVLRTRGDATDLFFFDKLVAVSKGVIQYQLIGKKSNEIIYNDIVIVSKGSFQLFDDTKGIPFPHLIQSLEMLANIFSTCRHYLNRSCTLKIVSSPNNLGNVLATGVLGGAIIEGRKKHYGNGQTLEECTNENVALLLKKFVRKNGWKMSF